MPLVKVSEAKEAALDWAVATIEGKEIYLDKDGSDFMCLGEFSLFRFSPTKYWAQGGPIIEREKINLASGSEWEAAYDDFADVIWKHVGYGSGPTPLIAAMRCYVASKLGESIEIPEELVCQMKN